MRFDSTLVDSFCLLRPSLNRDGLQRGGIAASAASVRYALPLFFVAMLAAPLAASPLLDQENVVDSAIADTASQFSQELGQTFTVGLSGPLSRIEVQMSRFQFTSDNAVLTVYSTTGGLPDAVLGSASVSSALISTTSPTFVGFDFAAPGINAQTNDVLAFGISSSDVGLYLMPYSTTSSYAGGQGVRRTLSVPPDPWQANSPARDYGFRTYVGFGIPIPGDFNANSRVDAADYVLWRDNLGAPTEEALNGNGNGMNGVDQGDYVLWRSNFGVPAGVGAGDSSLAAVPEPTSVALIALGFLLMLSPRQRMAFTA